MRASKKAKEKDPKALSGGEKSFSTVCLLLALWDSMATPFRALDEFDVFMVRFFGDCAYGFSNCLLTSVRFLGYGEQEDQYETDA